MYYLLASIFITMFMIETIVTGNVLMHRQALKNTMSTAMRYWAIGSLMIISATNILGFLWLKHNHDMFGAVDQGNWVQALFALGTGSLFVWVLVFHEKILKRR